MEDFDSDIMVSPFDVEPVWIDRGTGSGALSATKDFSKGEHADYEYANDGRSDTRTTFYWRGDDNTPHDKRSRDRHQLHRDPEDRRSWKKLADWNDGVGDPSRKQDNYDADLSRWTQTFCNQLDLNSYLYERVWYIVNNLDLTEYGSIPAEQIILGVITLVIDSETERDPDEWTPDDWIVYRDDFESLMDDVEMDRGRLWKVRKRVHQGTEFFDDDSS